MGCCCSTPSGPRPEHNSNYYEYHHDAPLHAEASPPVRYYEASAAQKASQSLYVSVHERDSPVYGGREPSLPSSPGRSELSSETYIDSMAGETPKCAKCKEPTVRRITKKSNRTGNGGRPYFKCDPCDKFHGFDDDHGLDDRNNPVCDCGKASRRQVSSPDRGRKVHYVCAKKVCDFYKGTNVAIPEDLVSDFSKLNII